MIVGRKKAEFKTEIPASLPEHLPKLAGAKHSYFHVFADGSG
jgi:hypothetical protein